MNKNSGLMWVLFGAILATVFAGATASYAPATVPSSQPANEQTLDLGDKVLLKLVRIPAGKFLMGSPETEADRRSNEVQHEVTISKAFYMGITPVTVGQFAVFVKDAGYKTGAERGIPNSIGFEIKDGIFASKKVEGCCWSNPSFPQQADHPVVMVDLNDARAFCRWLSKKSGKTVGLPTEAQWEYACRAGTKTAYPWGDNPDDGKGWANVSDQSLQKKLPNAGPDWKFFRWDDGFEFTSPVASFKPNAFGLYDMIGNVFQWCQDRYGPYDKAAVTDPTGPTVGNSRVWRGGAWYSTPEQCRAAYRYSADSDIRFSFYLGFRVVVAAVRD